MRIKEDFKRLGYFWLPSNPERRVPGTLFINDGGEIRLEIFGLFDESIEGINRLGSSNGTLGRIVGQIEPNELVTLDNCFYIQPGMPLFGPSKSTIHVKVAYIGVAYDEDELTLFNNFRFSVEGLDEWLGISGLSFDYENDFKTATIKYSAPKETTFNIKSGLKLSVEFDWTLPEQPIKNSARITHKAYLNIFSELPIPLFDFIETAYKLTNFISFAIDKTVCIESVMVTNDSIRMDIGKNKSLPVQVAIYYASLPYAKYPAKVNEYEMLFGFQEILNDAERKINNWLEAYAIIDPALSLYFSTKVGAHKYLESKFLALAQGLETYNRKMSNATLMDEESYSNIVENLMEKCPEEKKDWLKGRLLHGNELSLSQRIKRIIEPFKKLLGASAERNKLIRSIVNTRNYLTHYDEKLKKDAVTGEELWFLCVKMEAIFQLHLLQVLGFTNEEVNSVFNRSYELQKKLSK
ncbi:hypothetical protein NP603_21255 [Methylomonas sp. SURF-1]|uniref:ApeA N-terminal domain-containing protein n=1 Tax=Methylomonas aurea TaxID=2952224 RepID=A0ABT1UPL5_9GAMM|nr:HEPN domain-containing protein [Methylomonas sp. SURF-1]MCQ8183649.1 hypothetical protein [Methylomonas sp. SURF-1]